MSLKHPDKAVWGLRAATKKALLAELAKVAAALTGAHERQVLDVLIERERLGSTGVGGGIAIPHGKLAGLGRVYEIFARLDKPVDFEAVDARPVDLVYLLLSPPDAGADHLQSLSRASRLLRDGPTCTKLRAAENEQALELILAA